MASQTAVAENTASIADQATATVRTANEELFAIRQQAPIYGPESGSLTETDPDVLELEAAGLNLREFLVDVTFENPVDPGESWSYGVLFGYNEGENDLRLILTSGSEWHFNGWDGEFLEFDSGTIERFTTTPERLNKLSLLVRDTEGVLFINDELIAFLDMSQPTLQGDVAVGINFFLGDEVTVATFYYSGFTVWGLP